MKIKPINDRIYCHSAIRVLHSFHFDPIQLRAFKIFIHSHFSVYIRSCHSLSLCEEPPYIQPRTFFSLFILIQFNSGHSKFSFILIFQCACPSAILVSQGFEIERLSILDTTLLYIRAFIHPNRVGITTLLQLTSC